VATGGVVNVPAVLVVGAMTWLQYRGVRESATFNNAVVIVKVAVLLLFLVSCWGSTKAANWSPFVPPAFGAWGVLRGSSVVFFSYIGFDSISTVAGEAKDPQTAIPIATLLSLAVCTVLYVLVGFTVTGLVAYDQLDVPDPIAVTVNAAGPTLVGLRPIIKIGALFGLTSVIVVLILGQARVFFAMADDGNLPAVFARVHPRYKTPYVTTVITGCAAALLAGLLPVDVLAEMMAAMGALGFGRVVPSARACAAAAAGGWLAALAFLLKRSGPRTEEVCTRAAAGVAPTMTTLSESNPLRVAARTTPR
jgi:APA family basic amino acid/polyamine antiporter